MSNLLQIKHGKKKPLSSESLRLSPLQPYELGYCEEDKGIYIGVPNSSDENFNKIEIQKVGGSLLDWVYPIGSIYITLSEVSPEILFGGRWEKVENAFLLGSSSTYPISSTGGNTNHMHTLTSGYADISFRGGKTVNILHYSGDGTDESWQANGTISGTNQTADTTPFSDGAKLNGHTDSSSNLPPYLAVNIWKRTA